MRRGKVRGSEKVVGCEREGRMRIKMNRNGRGRRIGVTEVTRSWRKWWVAEAGRQCTLG